MYKSGIKCFTWPFLPQPKFFAEMNIIIDLLNKQEVYFRNGREFNEYFKTIMAKLNHHDWTALSSQFMKNRLEVSYDICCFLVVAEFSKHWWLFLNVCAVPASSTTIFHFSRLSQRCNKIIWAKTRVNFERNPNSNRVSQGWWIHDKLRYRTKDCKPSIRGYLGWRYARNVQDPRGCESSNETWGNVL